MPAAKAAPYLVLDAASPLVSVAVGRGGEIRAVRQEEIGRSSSRLLALVDECLREAGVDLAGLAGLAALAGPGSFTGLRIGLTTILGLHQATGRPATALPTLPVLARAAGAWDPATGPAIGAVDALRGEWTVLAPGRAEPELIAEADLPALAPATLVGFGVTRLAARPDWPSGPSRQEGLRLREPGPLAPVALPLLDDPTTVWNPGLLTAPFYARPPAVTAPRARRPAP
jgi:tRNA threonylcarbamoyl adenosine modification protein YeaZ